MEDKKNILIVEDEAIIANVISLYLKKLNYGVSDIVDRGESVIAAVKNKKPDLILMDIRLPGEMDGIAVAEKISEFTDIPIIYITAFNNGGFLERAKKTNVYGYLSKPIYEMDLKYAIDIALYKCEHDVRLKIIQKNLETSISELGQNEEKFSKIFNNSPNTIFLTSVPEGEIVDVNDAGVKLVGVFKDDIIGKTTSELGFWEPGVRDDYIKRLLKEKKVINYECTFILKNRTIKVLISGEIIILDNKAYFLTIVNDITELKCREMELKQARDCLAEVLENSTDASYKRNLLTDKYEYLSPVFTKITGYDVGGFIGYSLGSIMKIFHPDDLTTIQETMTKILRAENKPYLQIEYRVKHKNTGKYVWLKDKFIVVRADKLNTGHCEPVAIIGSVSDITISKNIELELKELKDKQNKILNGELDIIQKNLEDMIAGNKRSTP